MLWRVSIYLIFLFYYTCNGQIMLAPIQQQIANAPSKLKQKLNVKLKGAANNSMKALKAKMPYEYTELPSQWALHETEAHYHWPVGQVRYYIDDNSYGEGVAHLLTMAFNSIRIAVDFDCPKFVRLVQKPIDGDWLHITNPNRVRPCVHEPGINQAGEIKIVLGYDCLKPRDVLHTVMHGLGFRDEVTHPKRDLSVRVIWENIQPAFRFMFRVQPVDTSNHLSEYDPMSVMHFHDRAYSVNGQATVVSVLPGLKIEPSDQLSRLDKEKIRRIFGNECKKLQIGNILNTCGSNNNIDLEGTYHNGNNAGPCYNVGGGDQVVVHGHDVQPEGGGNDGGLVIAGHDVDPAGGVAIPGHDVQLHDDGDKLVVVGNDVQADKNDVEGVSDQDVDNGLSGSKGLLTAPKGNAGSSVEGIIVGYDAEKQLNKLNSQKQHKLSGGIGSGAAGFEIPEDEAIIVGYNAESKNQLSKFKKQKQKKLFSGMGSAAGFDVPDDEAIIAGYEARPDRQ